MKAFTNRQLFSDASTDRFALGACLLVLAYGSESPWFLYTIAACLLIRGVMGWFMLFISEEVPHA